MSLLFQQLCPYYVPIRSPSFTQLCYFPIISLFCPYSSKIMSQLFPQLFPYYFPVISPVPYYFPYLPNYFPSISHRVCLLYICGYMWIYVDMPILSVRAYIIPINWWFQRDSHGFLNRQVRWVLLLGPRQAGRVQENRTAEVSDDRCWCFMKWQNMEHASKIWPLKKWGTIFVKAIKMDGPFWNKLTSLGRRFELEMLEKILAGDVNRLVCQIWRFYCQVVKVQWRSNESWKTLREFMSEAWFVRLWCCLEKEHTLWWTNISMENHNFL